VLRQGAALAALLAAAVAATPAHAAAPKLHPLHAVRGGPAPRIEDSRGRQVLLRGVNVNQLGDYYQANPAYPPTIPLRREDFAEMRALGFDVVRLIVHWSALEPRPGAFDRAYVARIREAIGWARDHGIYVVVDMHQDAWSKFVATPPGERCLPGFTPAVGFDGAPRWATLTDGLPTCKLAIRELSPAVAQAFTSFWTNRDGIQDHLVETWRRLARELAADPAVAGYDLLNEPHPGYLPAVSEATQLALYYRRAIAAIRAGEAAAPGGFHHIAFFEPGVLWSGLGVDSIPAPPLIEDANVVFAPHLYAESITLDRALGITAMTVERGFNAAEAAARAYGTTVWDGEWGWFGDPDEDAEKVARYARQEDEHVWGGAWWDWKQACGDPHMIAAPGGEPGGISPSLNRFRCPGQEPLGIPAPLRRILARVYPRAAPGVITSLASDADSGAFRVAGRDADPRGSCRLALWAPGRAGTPPRLATTGARHVRVRPYAGGWLVTACVRGAWSVAAG
jgi:endoglycosylceramidase